MKILTIDVFAIVHDFSDGSEIHIVIKIRNLCSAHNKRAQRTIVVPKAWAQVQSLCTLLLRPENKIPKSILLQTSHGVVASLRSLLDGLADSEELS